MLKPSPIDIMRLMIKDSDDAVHESLARAGFAMTRSEWMMLHLIAEGCMTQVELRDELRVTQQFISKTLTQLTRQGCIAKQPSTRDRRLRDITLTREGLRAAVLVRAWQQRLAQCVPTDALTVDALLGFRRSLHQILEQPIRQQADLVGA